MGSGKQTRSLRAQVARGATQRCRRLGDGECGTAQYLTYYLGMMVSTHKHDFGDGFLSGLHGLTTLATLQLVGP